MNRGVPLIIIPILLMSCGQSPQSSYVENWTQEEKREVMRLSNYHGPNYKYICKPGHKKNVYYLLRDGQEIKILEWNIDENSANERYVVVCQGK